MFDDFTKSLKKMKRRLRELEFIMGAGELSRKYVAIVGEAGRLAFLMEHFGMRALEVRAARQEFQAKILAARFRAR